jgi:thiol-disulfide isomerase/thioredoxin
MRDKSDLLLNRVATVASAVLVTVFAGTLLVIAWPRIAAATGSKPAPPPPAYQTGDVIDVPVEWYRESARTLVLFGQASCGACQDAKPFLQQLVSDLRDRAAVVVASPGQAMTDDTAWAAAIGVPETTVHAVPRRLRVRVTPTLVVVNQQGEILGAWEGVGPPDTQPALAQAIEQALAR